MTVLAVISDYDPCWYEHFFTAPDAQWTYCGVLGLSKELTELTLQHFFLCQTSARSIIVSNTTCCCNHTILLLVFIYICLLEWFNFSRSIGFTYLVNCFEYLLVSSVLLTGQLPTLSTMVFRVSLSFFSLLHWNIRRSTVCVPCLYGHSGLAIIFNRCKYDRISPWPDIIVATFGPKVKFTASLLSALEKKFFSNCPLTFWHRKLTFKF
jgi:hypothetical protein